MKRLLVEASAWLSKGKLRRAKEAILQIEAEGHHHSDLYYLSGEVDRRLLLLEEAESKLIKSLTFQVFTPKVYWSLGLLYSKWEMWEKAISCL